MSEERKLSENVVRYFGPQWFGSVMGTGALAIAFSLVSDCSGVYVLNDLARIFTGLTIVLFVVYLIPWTVRFFTHWGHVLADIKHPIRGQFFPTMPISIILIGIDLAVTFKGVLSTSTLMPVVSILFFVGSIGIFIAGFSLLLVMFVNKEIGVEHGVFAWYIPPVSYLIIPVLGFILAGGYYAGTEVGTAICLLSVFALGIGVLMFLFFGAIILYRYTYGSLSKGELAPTFIMGLAPTSVLVIVFARFLHALNMGSILGLHGEGLISIFKFLSFSVWGFSAWWFVLTLFVLVYYVKKMEHPFSFTWWAYTFPLGAFAISSGAVNQLFPHLIFSAFLVGGTALLFLVWFVVFALTVRMVIRGEAFRPK